MKRIGNVMPRSGLMILLTALAVGLYGQPVVNTSFDAKQVLVQETFTWKIEVEGSDEMPVIRLPNIDKLALVSGPMQSSNYSYINGKMSSTKTLSYTFVALEAGKVTIPSVEVRLGRDQVRTKALTVEVVAAKTGGGSTKNEASVFLRAIPSKRNIYLGEPLSVQYKLFTQVGVYNYQVDKLPDAVGFWAEEINQNSQPRLVSEVIDGVRYNTAVLKTVLYYPTRSGDLVIDPLSTELEIEVKSNQQRRRVFNDPFFNDPFFRGTQRATRTFTSDPVKITVKALPEPKPRNFSGAVGNFQIKASLDTNAVMENDAVGLTIKLSGSGNFKSIQVPEPILPEGVDVFKPERVEKVSISSMRHSGSKAATYLLVPREAGTVEIPALVFSYFDLRKQKYITQSTGPIKLSVYDASGSQPVVTSGYSREEVTLMQEDIRYIKESSGDMMPLNASPLGWSFWGYHILGLGILVGLYLFQERQQALKGNKHLLRSSKAMSQAKTQLKKAKKLEENAPELQSLLYNTIVGFIGARLGLAENALDLDTLMAELAKTRLAGDTLEGTRTFLNDLTMDRFAPGAVKRSSAEWIEQTTTLLAQLGRVL
jgi:hypothetical protein